MTPDIEVNELKIKLESEEDFVLIDVREPHENAEFNVGGELIPLGNLPGSIDGLRRYQKVEIVLYCRSGKRSGMAKQFMEQQGFSNVRNLLGGMLEWQDTFGGKGD